MELRAQKGRGKSHREFTFSASGAGGIGDKCMTGS